VGPGRPGGDVYEDDDHHHRDHDDGLRNRTLTRVSAALVWSWSSSSSSASSVDKREGRTSYWICNGRDAPLLLLLGGMPDVRENKKDNDDAVVDDDTANFPPAEVSSLLCRTVIGAIAAPHRTRSIAVAKRIRRSLWRRWRRR
jgi:hypothetical protein